MPHTSPPLALSSPNPKHPHKNTHLRLSILASLFRVALSGRPHLAPHTSPALGFRSPPPQCTHNPLSYPSPVSHSQSAPRRGVTPYLCCARFRCKCSLSEAARTASKLTGTSSRMRHCSAGTGTRPFGVISTCEDDKGEGVGDY